MVTIVITRRAPGQPTIAGTDFRLPSVPPRISGRSRPGLTMGPVETRSDPRETDFAIDKKRHGRRFFFNWDLVNRQMPMMAAIGPTTSAASKSASVPSLTPSISPASSSSSGANSNANSSSGGGGGATIATHKSVYFFFLKTTLFLKLTCGLLA